MERSTHNARLETDIETRPATDYRSASLQQELLDLLARNARRVPVPVFLATGLIAAVVYDTAPTVWPLLWLAGVAAFLVIRYVYLTRLPERVDLSEAARLRIAAALSAINGALHGSSLVFFPLLDEFDRLLVTVMMLALCAGSVGSTVGYRPLLLAYVLPVLVPLSVLWAINPGAEAGWREVSMAGLILLFIALLLTMARDAFRLFRESFEIRLEHVELNKRLETALDESRIANDAKTRFLAAASHDLRQPVHALALFSAALARRPLDEKTRDIAGHIQSALDALSLQLDALLDISKLDAGVVEPRSAAFDLCAMLERLREQFAPLAADKGLELTVQCPGGAAVHTDEMLLEQIIRNLLSNAVKYTDAGTIEVRAGPSDGKYLLEVADTGQGIPREAQTQVFEEFFQVDNPNRDRSQGFGLGLAIIKRLVELLSIPLDMESEVGKGTTVRLALTPAASIPRRGSAPGAEFPFEGLAVLVVDDEKAVLEGMKTLLGGLGCDVSAVDGTARAVASANRALPDVVICDYRLSGEDDGLDTVNQLRKAHPGLPAILVTGDTSADRLREVRDAGLTVLHKPIRVDNLKTAIEEACTTTRGTSDARQQRV